MKHDIQIRKITPDESVFIVTMLKEHEEQMLLYARQLLWWNDKVNLISRDVSHETLKSHIKHSLCVALMSEFVTAQYIIDAGSGGGLPGLPLAIVHPEKKFVLNDIVAKKIFVANDLVNKLSLNENVSTHSGSIAKANTTLETLIVTKHAFKVYELCDYLVGKDWKAIIFLKGKEEALVELGEVEEAFSVEIIDLETEFMGEFYKGKAVVQVKRKVVL